MAIRRMAPSDLEGKTIDVHSHVGVSLKSYACLEYPYAQTIEGLYYRQLACHVDVNVVFPFSPDLHFDLQRLIEGTVTPDSHPISPAPYVKENRLLMQEVFHWCPELQHRFLPFVSVDPGRNVAAQIAELERLESEFPIYGIKILPVFLPNARHEAARRRTTDPRIRPEAKPSVSASHNLRPSRGILERQASLRGDRAKPRSSVLPGALHWIRPRLFGSGCVFRKCLGRYVGDENSGGPRVARHS